MPYGSNASSIAFGFVRRLSATLFAVGDARRTADNAALIPFYCSTFYLNADLIAKRFTTGKQVGNQSISEGLPQSSRSLVDCLLGLIHHGAHPEKLMRDTAVVAVINRHAGAGKALRIGRPFGAQRIDVGSDDRGWLVHNNQAHFEHITGSV